MKKSIIKTKNKKQVIYLFMIGLLILNVTSAIAQKPLTRKLTDTRFTEHYRVSETDTACLMGDMNYITSII